MIKRLVMSVLLVLACGCAPDNLLGGSVGELIDLSVSRVEVHRNSEALQLTYYRNRGVYLDVVIRVGIALKDIDLKPGTKIILSGEYEPSHPRTTVVHAPGGEPSRIFPRVKSGDVVVSAVGEPGDETKGNFSMLFESEGGDLGFGRTLTGTFAGSTVDAGFNDPLPDAGVP